MSFEDVDRKVKEALSKHNITFRTAEEANLANFTMLLTENAQKEALEYEPGIILRKALGIENQIKQNFPAYKIGDPNAVIPEGVLEDNTRPGNRLYKIGKDGNKEYVADPRKSGLMAHYRQAYEKDGLDGIAEIIKKELFQPGKALETNLGTKGVVGTRSSDDVLSLQSELIEHVKSNQLSAVISNGPSLDDIKAAIANKGAQPMTKSVSLSRETLSKIIEGSEVAAKVMRSRVF